MHPSLRRRKPPPKPDTAAASTDTLAATGAATRAAAEAPSPPRRRKERRWSCVDRCCRLIGLVCSIWWVLLFLYNAMPASFPQYVTEAINGPLPDPPGVMLQKEGLRAKHPVVFVPGIVTGGLELWEGHHCAEGLFRKRLW